MTPAQELKRRQREIGAAQVRGARRGTRSAKRVLDLLMTSHPKKLSLRRLRRIEKFERLVAAERAA